MIDSSNARARTSLYMKIHTRLFSHLKRGLFAPTDGEKPLQHFQRFFDHRAAVRPKIFGAVLIYLPYQKDAGPFFVHGDLDVRVLLIVAQYHIVARPVFLDEVVLHF